MRFYITTPIYYVNDTPHIGHAYTTVIADVLARYHRLFGDETLFLTGTDEHGQKVQAAARARGVAPQQHVDELHERFREVWQELEIAYDIFMRTTFDYHVQVVQEVLQELFDKGEIYQDTYEGWYSVSEEIFYTEKDLVDGKSPAGKEVTRVEEKNYFFRMSKYQQRLIDYIEQHPEFIQPAGKRSEVLGFLKQPLADLCISRPKSRLSWGIEIPFDRDYVTYVWFDALLNYVSALGYRQSGERKERFNRLWGHTVHLLGKDILTTHAVYWSTMLMALGLPLPRTIFAHGWWLVEGNKKMSKSEGPVVKPLEMKDLVGVEQFRYFLSREVRLGNDAVFSRDAVVQRVNSELANNLGNLASRCVQLVAKNFDGAIPARTEEDDLDHAQRERAIALAPLVEQRIRALDLDGAIEACVELLTATNGYIDTRAPWRTAKSGDLPRTGTTLYMALETLRIVGTLLSPVMPSKMGALLESIGWNGEVNLESAKSFGLLPVGGKVIKGDALFPRLELPK